MNILKKIILLLTVISVLIIFELFSYYTLLQTKNEKDLFIKKPVRNNFWCNKKNYVYTQIDPLLGWSIDYSKSSEENYTEKTNSTVLSSSLNLSCRDTIIIYVSGGSTSDIIYDASNWPKSLQNIFSKNNICSEIYVAAVAGYNSGQELLKSIRDIHTIKPDIHISYSGVNEMSDPSYVSQYETTIIKSSLHEPKILPNSITLVKKIMKYGNNVSLKGSEKYNAVDFWAQNMKNMNSLAEANNYIFVGVLQPVFYYTDYFNNFKNKELNYFANEYIRFYPKARTITSKTNYLVDYSRTFETLSDEAFKDDCHLSDIKYQNIIAQKVFKLIDSLVIVKSTSF